MWEYDRVVIEFIQSQELIDVLNQYGSEDWEVFDYNETKASKFGEKNVSVVLIKKRNHANEKECSDS